MTKAYKLAGDRLPPSVWKEICTLSANHRVDLNSCLIGQNNSFVIGYIPTKLVIRADKNGAHLLNLDELLLLGEFIEYGLVR